MLIEPSLCRLIVVGCHEEKSVRTGLLRLFRELHRGLRAVGARACDHGDPMRCDPDAVADHIHMFRLGERRGLSRRPAGNDGVRSSRDLFLQNLRELLIIHGAVFMHRRDQRHACAPEYRHIVLLSVPRPPYSRKTRLKLQKRHPSLP